MRWTRRPSRIKAWIDKHRQENWDGDSQLILALFPKKIGGYRGDSTCWLSPVVRTRHVSSHSGTNFFGGDTLYVFCSYDYSEPDEESPWKTWITTRPLHHLAGLVYFSIYHLWVVVLSLLIVSPMWGPIILGFNPATYLLNLLFG